MCIRYAMLLKMQLKSPSIFSVNFIQHNCMQTTHCTKLKHTPTLYHTFCLVLYMQSKD